MSKTTSFFSSLAPLLKGSTRATLVVEPLPNGALTVSFLPKNEQVTDDALALIQPLIMTGTADELDAEFFGVIEKGVAPVQGLVSNMAAFEASVAKAKAESEMEKKSKYEEKKKAEAAKKSREEADKKLSEFVKEATEQDTAAAIKTLEVAISKYKTTASEKALTQAEEALAEHKKKVESPSLFS